MKSQSPPKTEPQSTVSKAHKPSDPSKAINKSTKALSKIKI